MSAGILVLAEQRNGEVKKASIEAVAEALRWKGALGGGVTAAVFGSGVGPAASALAGLGIDRVLAVDHADLARYSTESHRAAAMQAIAKADPAYVFCAATVQGRDLAGAVAGAAEAGYAAECTALRAEGGRLIAVRPVFAGKALLTVACRTPRFVLSLRPNVFDAGVAPGAPAAPIEPLAFAAPPIPRAVVTAIAAAAKGRKDVAEADIVVSGGRGLGGPEGFKVLEDLADVLGAAVGASRAVVDLGWRPHADQVGQTGKVVSPKLYIACGVSGAIQHLAGMRTSKVIVAINKDAEAPIFKVADYGIVGDALQVVPALTEALKKAL
jgi:electron transfer flavoprotein alpha subunit